MAITTAMRTQVTQLYVALFGRAPEADGLGFWVQKMGNGETFAAIAQQMFQVDAARTYYPSFLTNEEIVSKFYVNVLGRSADSEGLAFWTAKLNSKGATPGSVLGEMITAVANYTGTDPEGVQSTLLFNNKVVIGEFYAVTMGGNSVEGAKAILTNVTADPATVEAAKDQASALTGTTLLFTNSVDNLLGGIGADTFVGVGGQISMADTVAGGSGKDVLKLHDATVLPAMSGIDILQLVNPAANLNFSGTTFSDYVEISELATSRVTTLGNLAPLRLTNVTVAQEIRFADGVTAGAADTLAVRLDNFCGPALTMQGIETLNFTSVYTGGGSVTQNLVTLVNAVNNITVQGTTRVEVDVRTNNITSVQSFDASKMTAGGVKFSAGNNANTITGSAAADDFVFSLGEFTTADKVNGGNGVDMITLSETSFTSADAAHVRALNAAVGVEALNVCVGGTTVDTDVITAMKIFRPSGTGTYAFQNMTADKTLEVLHTVLTGVVTLANKVGEGTSTLKLTANMNSCAWLQDFRSQGTLTLNVESTFTGPGSQTPNILQFGANADNMRINITGSQGLELKGLQAIATGAMIDGSASTGKLQLTGTGKADVIVGGTRDDQITGAGGLDVLTGGAGNDLFVLRGGDTVVAGAANMVTIQDWISGDKIALARGANSFLNGLNLSTSTAIEFGAQQTVASANSASEVFAGLAAVAASTNTALQVVTVRVAAGSAAGVYQYINDDAAGVSATDDVLVKLAGASATDSFAGSIVTIA